MKIFIGEQNSEFIEIEIKNRLYPNALDYWDGNYLKVLVIFELGVFKGSFLSNVRIPEVNEFLKGLNRIYETMQSNCILSNVDENFIIKGTVDYTGAINWDCTLNYPAGSGAVLKYKFNTSLSLVNTLIATSKKILEQWHIIGEDNK